MATVNFKIDQVVAGGRWVGDINYEPATAGSLGSKRYTGTMTFTPDGTIGGLNVPLSVTDGSLKYLPAPNNSVNYTIGVGKGGEPFASGEITADSPGPGYAQLDWQTSTPTSAFSVCLAPGATYDLRGITPSGGGATGSMVVCFYPGTLIATPRGDVRVEDLAIGDTVLTADGQERNIVWIGRQTIATCFADPKAHMPIEFAIGSLGDHLPRRPLRLSPGHSIWLDGAFPIASALVNHSTIRQLTKSEVPERFTYYHIELEDHALVLAEGVPAETFMDAISRKHFHNWHEYVALYGADERSIAPLTDNNARITRFEDLPEALRDFIGPPLAEPVDAPGDLKLAS